MLERYSHPIVNAIWNEQSKFDRWAEVEVAACRTFFERGEIPHEDMMIIESADYPKADRIKEIEKETDHDVVAFVHAFSENIGKAARHIHRGLTSSDICDTAQAIAIKETIKELEAQLGYFMGLVADLAYKYKLTPCIGRTHGVHAEVTTFGMRLAGWYSELQRGAERLKEAKKNMLHGKLSGAVGTYSQTDPEFEKDTLKKLRLNVEPVATQVIPRDRYAALMSTLSLIGSSLERMAIEIRSLQRTEIREVEEGFKKGQTGSSAMPHKRNPISSEKVSGLARVLRGYMMVAHENIALWHDRDISHSSAERIILPDAFHTIFHMIQVMEEVLMNLQIFPEKMRRNIYLTRGLVFSQNILGWFLSRGMTRTEAYKVVQTASKMVIEENYETVIGALEDLCEWLTAEDVNKLVDLADAKNYLKHIDAIFERVF